MNILNEIKIKKLMNEATSLLEEEEDELNFDPQSNVKSKAQLVLNKSANSALKSVLPISAAREFYYMFTDGAEDISDDQLKNLNSFVSFASGPINRPMKLILSATGYDAPSGPDARKFSQQYEHDADLYWSVLSGDNSKKYEWTSPDNTYKIVIDSSNDAARLTSNQQGFGYLFLKNR